jgi:hypothetical protein
VSNNKLTLVIALIAVVGIMTAVVSTEQVMAKKHAECFKDGSDDGKWSNAFDAGRFVHCGKNYQDGFLKGCQSAGNDKQTCEENEDSQDNEPAN